MRRLTEGNRGGKENRLMGKNSPDHLCSSVAVVKADRNQLEGEGVGDKGWFGLQLIVHDPRKSWKGPEGIRTEAETMEGCCFLARLFVCLARAQLASLYNPGLFAGS